MSKPLYWVVFDLDGCLSDDSRRLKHLPICGQDNDGTTPHNAWDDYHTGLYDDPVLAPGEAVFQYFNLQPELYNIAIATARPDLYRRATCEWIDKNLKPRGNWHIYMRPNGDNRRSPDLKLDMVRRLADHTPGMIIHRIFDDREDVAFHLETNGFPARILNAESDAARLIVQNSGPAPAPSPHPYLTDTLPTAAPKEVQSAWPFPTKHPVAATLQAMSETFQERNGVYGDSAVKVGQVMKVLFPDGYACRTEADHRMMDHFNRVIAKLVRFVNSGMTHADSIHDLAVYAAMCEVEAAKHAIDVKPLECEE